MMAPEPMLAKLQLNISLRQVMYGVLFVILYIHGTSHKVLLGFCNDNTFFVFYLG